MKTRTCRRHHPTLSDPIEGNRSHTRPGFTLLEVAIALVLIALLSGLILTTARYSLLLGNNVVQSQNEEMLHQAFFDLLESRFASLPGNTRMQITVTDTASHYLSDITLQNVPISLTWGNEDRTAKAIQLSTVKRASGLLDIVLRYYENEILDPTGAERLTDGLRANAASARAAEKPFTEIILLTDVRFFEWRVIDGITMDPEQYDWDLPGRLPLQLELTCAFGGSGEVIRHMFWIPPRQNPETFIQQLTSNRAVPPSTPQNPDDPPNPPGVNVSPVFPPPPSTQ